MSKKYAGFNLSKLRFYVEHVVEGRNNAVLVLYIDEGNVHPRQTKHHVSASFNCRIPKYAEFWNNDEYYPNVRAWCVKQATKLDLFNKLKEAVYANCRKGSK